MLNIKKRYVINPINKFILYLDNRYIKCVNTQKEHQRTTYI